MAEITPVLNNTANVSSTKGVMGGYIFAAPVGTPLPTDIKTPLDPHFGNLGFISEDGYAESIESDSNEIKDMNGSLIDATLNSRVESAQLTLAEVKASTLKVMYGEDNVTDADGLITVLHNGNSTSTWAVVLELVLKDGRRWRKVVPQAQSSELDTLTLAVAELAGRALTWKYLTDEAGNTCYDYIESTETKSDVTVAVTGVTIDETLSVAAGAKATPHVELQPTDATDTKVTFTSSNTKFATVNETTGEVTGVAAGSCDVTVTTHDGNHTATCAVTVTAATK